MEDELDMVIAMNNMEATLRDKKAAFGDSEFYTRDDIKFCPICGCTEPDPVHKQCWHCSKCSFARCAYTKEAIDKLFKIDKLIKEGSKVKNKKEHDDA